MKGKYSTRLVPFGYHFTLIHPFQDVYFCTHLVPFCLPLFVSHPFEHIQMHPSVIYMSLWIFLWLLSPLDQWQRAVRKMESGAAACISKQGPCLNSCPALTPRDPWKERKEKRAGQQREKRSSRRCEREKRNLNKCLPSFCCRAVVQ